LFRSGPADGAASPGLFLQGWPGTCEIARAGASAIEGVIEASANPATGSLIIHYDREALTPERLWGRLCEQRLVSGPSIFADCPITRANLHPPAGASVGDWLVDAVLGVVIDKLVARSTAAVTDALI
jgi:hypothetical protein